MKPLLLLGVVVCLLTFGCDDSKNPLSDPKTSKADERLIGVWWGRGWDDDNVANKSATTVERGSVQRRIQIQFSQSRRTPDILAKRHDPLSNSLPHHIRADENSV